MRLSVVAWVLLQLGIVLILWSATAEAAETLRNDDIISMKVFGLADEAVILKIENTRTAFSLTSADLAELKKENVSDALITAMMKAGGYKVCDTGSRKTEKAFEV